MLVAATVTAGLARGYGLWGVAGWGAGFLGTLLLVPLAAGGERRLPPSGLRPRSGSRPVSWRIRCSKHADRVRGGHNGALPMSVLRSIEHRIESIVEGVFGRAFRTHVQPVELARKLAKEMDDAKSVSVSRVYVPNEYTLYLCPSDRDQFANYEDSLRTELSDYLSEHARREGYALLSTPQVLIEEDDDLNVGEFGIATTHGAAGAPAGALRRPPDVVAAGRFRARRRSTGRRRVHRGGLARGWLTSTTSLTRRPRSSWAASVTSWTNRALVIGRSREADITVDDPNVSRRHAEVRHEDGAYWIVDLGSTNGITINGKRVERAKLEPDDEIVLGTTERAVRARFLGAQGPACPSSPSSSRSRPPSSILLYVFIWRVVRSASRGLPVALPGELRHGARAGRPGAGGGRDRAPGRLVVMRSKVDPGRDELRARARADDLRPRRGQCRACSTATTTRRATTPASRAASTGPG